MARPLGHDVKQGHDVGRSHANIFHSRDNVEHEVPGQQHEGHNVEREGFHNVKPSHDVAGRQVHRVHEGDYVGCPDSGLID